MASTKSPALTPEEHEALFWSRAKFNVFNGCWEWTRSRTSFGHGVMKNRFYGTPIAHRIAWMLTFGQIPTGLAVLHNCDNPCCINPSHLRLGTWADNAQDRESRGRGGNHKGERNGRAILNADAVRSIRAEHASIPRRGGRMQLAAKYGVTWVAIAAIIQGRTWKNVE
jgi:hypothetical protein